MRSRPVVSTAIVLLVSAAAVARQQQTAPQRAGSITEGVTAVLVDVVVRDRRGQPVRDLTESDFELLEDGVPQKISSFAPVAAVPATGAGSAGPPLPTAAASAEGAPAPSPAAPAPIVTALVFHALSPDSRHRALQAAQTYVGDKEETANYIGVFGLDLTLAPLVPFTRNGLAVRQALVRIAGGGGPGLNSPEQQRQASEAQQQATNANQAIATATAAGGANTANTVANEAAAAQMATMSADMVQGFNRMDRDQQGYLATDALFAIVNTLRRLPGRKSVVLFSEGLAVPPAVHRLFLGVIDAASRANVSIYTIDAAGLRTDSDQSRIRDLVNGAVLRGIETSYSGGGGDAFTRGLETNEDNLRGDPQAVLGQLARDTGGLLFSSTNNLGAAFERIESDMRNYYLIGYTPLNPAYDGRFRSIQVKVKRDGVTIAARRGYFAVRNPGTLPINPLEAPALAALDQKPVPNAFPVRAGALLFPERGRPGLVPVVVEVNTAPLTFQPAPDGKTLTSNFVVLVRFLDRDHQVVRKVSEHYQIRGELAQIDHAKLGTVVFYRESELPAGIYSMETVVHDAPSGKSSVRFATVEVPRHPENTLRMSSLVLVRSGETVPEKDRRPDNPLMVNGVALAPNLGDAIGKASKEVTFYFAVYPGKQGSGPDVMIELLQNGRPVSRLPMPVPPADASGRIQQLGRLPIDQLASGTYELRAIVKQGDQQAMRSTLLRIAD
jgi:VWFA-related protein